MASMQPPTLTFLGAAGTVTGSKYLLEYGDRRVLVDAGLFQGEKEWRVRNWEEFPVPPDTITDVILTHVHMDHCGYLPALVKQGFAGDVWCTPGTAALAPIVLRDAGHLAERDAKEAREGGWSKHQPPLPIYTIEDVERALPLLRPAAYDDPHDLGDGLTVQFTRAGHILGSASVHLTIRGEFGQVSVLFSGDLGRAEHPVLRARETPPGADYVLVESTYGDREHPEPRNLPHEPLADAIRRTVQRGGSVLIPAFAVDRTEVVLREIARMRADGRIPEVPVFVNSPMGLDGLRVYRAATEELRPDLSPSDFADQPWVTESRTMEDSMALTRRANARPCVIISSSGMATGGRVLHHLESMLPDVRNAVVLTGYQAVGTRGRALRDGVTQLKMHGRYVPVLAEIVVDEEFSVHADGSDLVDWTRSLEPTPALTFVTHGEAGSSAALAARLHRECGLATVVPSYGERVVLAPRTGQTAAPAPTRTPQPAPGPLSRSTATLSDGLTITGVNVGSDLHVVTDDGAELVLEGTVRITLRRGDA